LWHVHYRRDLFPNGIQWERSVEPKTRTIKDALEGASELSNHIVSPVQQKTYDKFSNLWPAMNPGSYANNWLRKTGRWDMVDPSVVKTKTNGEKFVFYESVASKRLAWDQTAPTITGSTLLIHPDGTRPLTTREYLRINGMPDTFSFPPSIRPGNHITYIGKTVSLGIAMWVIENIKLNIASIQK
jgi:site-specific DNA-cytosine methylase